MLTPRLHGESDLGHCMLTSSNSEAEDVSGELRGPDELVGVTRSIEKLLAIALDDLGTRKVTWYRHLRQEHRVSCLH